MPEDEDATFRFKVGDVEYEAVPFDDLEFQEVELIEEAFNLSIEDIDFNRAKAIRWLVFITMKRKDPSIEFAALGGLKFSELNVEPVPPTKPKAKPKAKAG